MKITEIIEKMREYKFRLLQVEHDLDRVDARIQEIALFAAEKSEGEHKKAFHAKRKLLGERLNLKREIEDLEMEITLHDYSE